MDFRSLLLLNDNSPEEILKDPKSKKMSMKSMYVFVVSIHKVRIGDIINFRVGLLTFIDRLLLALKYSAFLIF